MKVLIGVDGSEGSFAAVRQTGRLLSAAADQVALYYSPPDLQRASPSAAAQAAAESVSQSLVRAVMDEARQHLPQPLGDQVHEIVGTQPPRHGLIVAADEWRADLIAVGARGIGPMKRLTLGSVSSSVVQTSTRPVLVIRERAAASRDLLRILLADDGSETSRDAGSLLGRFTWPAGTEGYLLHVVESFFAGELPPWLLERARDSQTEAMARQWYEEHQAACDAKRRELLAYREQLPDIFQGRDPLIAEGHSADQIIQTIESEHIDLAVLGTRGQGAWRRLLIGSTLDRVLKHAPCHVLAVPRPV